MNKHDTNDVIHYKIKHLISQQLGKDSNYFMPQTEIKELSIEDLCTIGDERNR